eukprot:TRINITY_DN20319_c0_g1_i3.p1 TRINITY_DN20319_c0_g1~~TRINITY_DN20319_c0_g1_i3.p1  ORF type:complete len:289 (+),score=35.49 TRINITY_DN20319_c0_g1_i3:228-1094(+)
MTQEARAADTPIDATPPAKNARMSLPDEPPLSWLQAFGNLIDTKFTPIAQQVERVENKQNQIQTDITSLDSRLRKLEATPPSLAGADAVSYTSSTVAPDDMWTNVEIKGWCSRDNRSTAGYTRQEATVLLNELRGAVPEAIRSHVKEVPIVFGARSANMLVRVSVESVPEVIGIFKEVLNAKNIAAQNIDQNAPVLFVRKELPMWRRKANAQLAKLNAFIKSNLSDGSTDIQWNPDFAVCATKGNQSCTCVRLNESDRFTPIWSTEAPAFLGLSTQEDLLAAFRAFKN